MADNRTEKATPKKRREVRQKGQVARSQDANGAIVLMASVLALSAFGPGMFERMEEATVGILTLIKDPSVVDRKSVADLFTTAGGHAFAGAAPIVLVCALAGV